MTDRTYYLIDYSRYRVAETIAELYAAGDPPSLIARGYFGDLPPERAEWVVELIVAAHDRKGRYEPGPMTDSATCNVCGKRVSLDPYGPGWVHTYPRWHIFARDGHAAAPKEDR